MGLSPLSGLSLWLFFSKKQRNREAYRLNASAAQSMDEAALAVAGTMAEGFCSQSLVDSCGPGFSCLDVAVRRLIEYECTHSVSEHRITLFLDLSCFYETIGHSRLVEHADTVSFPPLLLWGALCAYRGPRLLTADGLIGPQPLQAKGYWRAALWQSPSAKSRFGLRAARCSTKKR